MGKTSNVCQDIQKISKLGEALESIDQKSMVIEEYSVVKIITTSRPPTSSRQSTLESWQSLEGILMMPGRPLYERIYITVHKYIYIYVYKHTHLLYNQEYMRVYILIYNSARLLRILKISIPVVSRKKKNT